MGEGFNGPEKVELSCGPLEFIEPRHQLTKKERVWLECFIASITGDPEWPILSHGKHVDECLEEFEKRFGEL